jgi:hypothetical protein
MLPVMKNEDKIVELLSEMVKGQDKLVGEVTEMKKEMFKQSIQLSENSRAIIKLADEIRLVAEHEKRISKLELTVFK